MVKGEGTASMEREELIRGFKDVKESLLEHSEGEDAVLHIVQASGTACVQKID